TMFVVGDTLPIRLDYTLSYLQGGSLVFAGQMLLSGLIVEAIALGWPQVWQETKELEPSPDEGSLETRLLHGIAPTVLVLIILLMAGNLMAANNAARRMLEERMRSTATTAADSLPSSLETGQNLIGQLRSDERLYSSTNQEDLTPVLVEYFNKVPFFQQLTLLDKNGNFLAGHPISIFNDTLPTPEEALGIDLAQKGVAYQLYSLPPVDDIAGRLVFIATAHDETGARQRILIGRTNLGENPFISEVIDNLRSLADVQGKGMWVDDQGMILFHTDSGQVGTYFDRDISTQVFEPNDTAPDGTRQMLYIQPVPGWSWAIVTIIPTEIVRQLAIENAVPLLGVLLLVSVIGYLIMRNGLVVVTASIQDPAVETVEGDLDHTLTPKGRAAVGQVSQSLVQISTNLKTHMEEINRLLSMSRGVASTLVMDAAVKPILKGALATRASSARLVLAPAAVPEYDQDVQTHFGLGPSSERYAGLDNQVLELTERQPEVVMTNPRQARFKSSDGTPLPAAFMASALLHEDVHYGALWVAYDQPHRFTEEEVRFLNAVAKQAALAASKARLYLSTQLGRQRLEAILTSTPDPVLVTDDQNRVLLANPAAVTLLGSSEEPVSGKSIEEIIKQEELLNLFRSDDRSEGSQSVEVAFSGNKVFYATASPVLTDGQMMGRVCVLSDITHLKELDALKSDFVSTVSHDLRSPLTMMRGYTTMLPMVGELNELQTSYINYIVAGIESMSRLVNNLLDLGRIEAGVGLQLEMIQIAEVTRHITEEMQIKAIQEQVVLTLDLPSERMPPVEADQVLLHQAIYNLVENAIKYTESGGMVNVTVKVEAEQVIFEVRDTGVGISQVDLPRLFDKFFRAGSLQQRGSGLGLTIVKSITERHGGNVQVESQLGKGSTFTLTIPLRQPA
ncbi:MAG: sensor histidine kinase, partial [Anaerolineales bacterium]